MTALADRLNDADVEGDIYVSVPIVARMRDCAPRTIERAVASGRLPSVRTDTGRRLIRLRDLTGSAQ